MPKGNEMVWLLPMSDKLQAGAFSLSFSTTSFLKCSQLCVHEPDPVIGAGRLGAVTAPYPASPPSEPDRPRSGMGGGGAVLSCQTKCHLTWSFNISFLIKYPQFFVHELTPSSGLDGTWLRAWRSSQHRSEVIDGNSSSSSNDMFQPARCWVTH